MMNTLTYFLTFETPSPSTANRANVASFGARVNDSSYGLQAGLFIGDLKAVFQAYADLELGGVVWNDVPTYRGDPMPYGGVKDSGLGREGVRYAIEEMTEQKVLVLRQSD
jgi:acyl-CoA reductase-like NAD-dependent aldehyde dehydrogenase